MLLATVGSVIAVIKKATKVSGSEDGFKTIMLRKKRKGGVLAESVDNREVANKALGNCSWGSEVGDTTESESIDIEKEYLVEKTSVDYGENGVFAGEDPNQTPKSLCVKTKKVLGKPLGVINYDTVNVDDDVLDSFFLLLPPLPIKLFIQVSVRKSFVLDIDFVAVAGKSSQEKLNFVKKNFSDVNGFGGASTLSKFGGIIQTSFTSEKAMMVAAQLANNCGIVVNTNLKYPINNHTNQAIVLKKIPMETSIETVHAAISEFGLIKLIKMQLADLLATKWSILIGKDAVCVAWTNIDKQTWDARDEFRALLYTLPMGTTAHDFWDFIGSVGGKTCVIECSSGSLIQAMANTPVIKSVGFQWSCLTTALCSICRNSGHTSLACCTAGVSSSPRSKKAPLSAQDQLCLAKIYEKKSAPVSRPLAFGGKTWASMVGKPLPLASFSGSAQSGSVSYGKPLPTVSSELEDHLKNIESSLVSLAGQIGELAKRLDSFVLAVSQPSPGCQLPVTPPSQNQEEDIVMEVGLGNATSDKTAAIFGSTASPEVVKLENMLEGLSALVMSLSVHLDSLALAGVKHVYKVVEVPGRLLSVKLLFRNKLSVSILSLYAGASMFMHFSQADKINSLIAKAVNESFFMILDGDFNEDGSHKCASFRKCFDLGLVNALGGRVAKVIDYIFVSLSLVNAILDRSVTGVDEYFNTNHRAVAVSMGLGGLLDINLMSLCKQANKDQWKFNFKDATAAK
ncbi:hypothetical protein G9A89_014588 [Geosiphon pyriformis]|nr:hypothetical protein G9A89_014588 [Geosiphon pyriformis]